MPGRILEGLGRQMCFLHTTVTSVQRWIRDFEDRVYRFTDGLLMGTYGFSRPPDCCTDHCLEVDTDQVLPNWYDRIFPLKFLVFWDLTQKAIVDPCRDRFGSGSLPHRFIAPGMSSAYNMEAAVFFKQVPQFIGASTQTEDFVPDFLDGAIPDGALGSGDLFGVGVFCPKVQHLIVYSPALQQRCPALVVRPTSILAVTDETGAIKKVHDILDTNGQRFYGKMTSVAVSTRIGVAWTCGRRAPSEPWSIFTFPLWLVDSPVSSQLTAATEQVVRMPSILSGANSQTREVLRHQLDNSDRCVLTYETPAAWYDPGTLWVLLTDEDSPTEAQCNNYRDYPTQQDRERCHRLRSPIAMGYNVQHVPDFANIRNNIPTQLVQGATGAVYGAGRNYINDLVTQFFVGDQGTCPAPSSPPASFPRRLYAEEEEEEHREEEEEEEDRIESHTTGWAALMALEQARAEQRALSELVAREPGQALAPELEPKLEPKLEPEAEAEQDPEALVARASPPVLPTSPPPRLLSPSPPPSLPPPRPPPQLPALPPPLPPLFPLRRVHWRSLDEAGYPSAIMAPAAQQLPDAVPLPFPDDIPCPVSTGTTYQGCTKGSFLHTSRLNRHATPLTTTRSHVADATLARSRLADLQTANAIRILAHSL